MKTQLEGIEIQPVIRCDHQFAIEHATLRQPGPQSIDHLRKVAIERFFIPALYQYVVSVAKYQYPKAIPFRLEDPGASLWQLINSFREHWQNRRIHRKLHVFILYRCGL